MGRTFGLTCMVAILTLTCGFAGTAEAQIVSITNVQYTAANGNTPAKAEPKGTWSLPGGGDSFRVLCDYGTVNFGVFTVDATISPAVASATVIAKGGGGNFQWVVSNPSNLASVPANLNVRAIIEKYNANTQTWSAVGNIDYKAIP